MLAFTISGLAVLPLAFIASLPAAFLTTALFGVGLAGVILMGDMILADVIDEDELRTGQRREGSYSGLSGLITTLSTSITAAGWRCVTAMTRSWTCSPTP